MNENGAILYRGPSLIDGKPIVVIATGLKGGKSRNDKTGHMVQTWILREDISPVEAAACGEDVSICGTCPHRGQMVDGKNVNRSCYVTLFQAPLSVWRSYKRGIYAEISEHDMVDAGSFKTIRLGSYGDPAAVPYAVWSRFATFANGVTGYTHQWRTCNQALTRLCMASCDSVTDWMDAKRLGWRTFRVRQGEEPKLEREVVCPASKEAGEKTNCAACKACGGFGGKAKADIVIMAHGAPSKVNAFARNLSLS